MIRKFISGLVLLLMCLTFFFPRGDLYACDDLLSDEMIFGILVDHGYDLQFISDMDPVERENLTKALLDDPDDVQLIKSVDYFDELALIETLGYN
jgi:hypothetical protein